MKKELSINFMPIEAFQLLDREEKLEMIVENSKNEEIMVIEGLLRPEEEMDLIKAAMKEIGDEEENKFKGVEIGSITLKRSWLKEKENLRQKIRSFFLKYLIGRERGLTVIGPASLVKEVNQNPEKLTLKMK